MNNITLNRLNNLKNKITQPNANAPKDNFLEVLEEMNKEIWNEEDWEIAASVKGIEVEELKIKNSYYK